MAGIRTFFAKLARFAVDVAVQSVRVRNITNYLGAFEERVSARFDCLVMLIAEQNEALLSMEGRLENCIRLHASEQQLSLLSARLEALAAEQNAITQLSIINLENHLRSFCEEQSDRQQNEIKVELKEELLARIAELTQIQKQMHSHIVMNLQAITESELREHELIVESFAFIAKKIKQLHILQAEISNLGGNNAKHSPTP